MMRLFQRTYRHHRRSERGVALIVALFVLLILSILAIAIFSDVQGELKMAGIERNSERALKLAELGVQLTRGMVEQEGVSGEIASVDGFSQGGYFFATVGSGMPGNEKWEQWHYDSGITGYNIQSEVTTPLRPVWMKESPGRNGIFSGSQFILNNIFPIVVGAAYFPIEFDTETRVRAVDQYTGQAGETGRPVKYGREGSFTWEGDANGDKTIAESVTTAVGFNGGYAARMSPMGSYSNFSTVPGRVDPEIIQQTIYFTYTGDDSGAATTSSDTSSTVRLRAINALCNNSTDTTKTNALWEFDTGLHGIGTAPAVFDPSPDQPGDEIIYFSMVVLDSVNLRSKQSIQENPNHVADDSEHVYIYAVVDTTSSDPANAGLDECSKTGSYRMKWAHRFPDPDVELWTDYPAEELTGTNGMLPPYARRPSDMEPFMPEDDVLFDYRDTYERDNVPHHVRGNPYVGIFEPPSLSPVVVMPLYELDGTNLDGTKMVSDKRSDTIDGVLLDPDSLDASVSDTARAYGDPADPLIELYLVYVAHPMVKNYWGDKAMGHNQYGMYNWGNNWGVKKYTTTQTRVIALRDRLDGTCDSDNTDIPDLEDGENCTWNWDSAKSRFPTFKWSYRVPAHDPDRGDERPWNGYGEFIWETWFEQQVAPMIGLVKRDQDGAEWGQISGFDGGVRDTYPTLYVAYESLAFTDEGALDNTRDGPDTGDGFPSDSYRDKSRWGDSHLMIMGVRDTWDDYMDGNQTNPMFDDMVTENSAYVVKHQSRPAEPYWTHKHNGGDAQVLLGTRNKINEADGSMVVTYYPPSFANETSITYLAPESAEWQNNTDKIGIARPYVWTEDLWEKKVDNGHDNRDLDRQGWINSGLSSSNSSDDIDVEGETSAFCRTCLDGDGMLVSVFNHDLSGYEDLRMHAVNATTGHHVWDYHMPATLNGDYFNATPAIANGRVFVAYTVRNGSRRGAFMRVLNADTGQQDQEVYFDHDPNSRSLFDGGLAGRADALLLPPTIANGAVYMGTYHFRGTNSQSNDTIRIYAYSPVLRIFSIGIYPADFENMSTIPDLRAPEPKGTYTLPRAERKLQVLISGSGSSWQEIREGRQ